jgi:hypothetical protein
LNKFEGNEELQKERLIEFFAKFDKRTKLQLALYGAEKLHESLLNIVM